MEKSTASKLIAKHRRYWHSQESDLALARRTERLYLNVGLMFVGIALIDLIDSACRGVFTTYRISFAVIIFSLGGLIGWQSYRFTRVRMMLRDEKADSHDR